MTKRIKCKGRKSFLNYKLLISEIFSLLERKDLSSAISELKNDKNIRGQKVSWNKIRVILKDRDVVNKSETMQWWYSVCKCVKGMG